MIRQSIFLIYFCTTMCKCRKLTAVFSHSIVNSTVINNYIVDYIQLPSQNQSGPHFREPVSAKISQWDTKLHRWLSATWQFSTSTAYLVSKVMNASLATFTKTTIWEPLTCLHSLRFPFSYLLSRQSDNIHRIQRKQVFQHPLDKGHWHRLHQPSQSDLPNCHPTQKAAHPLKWRHR